VVFLLFFLRIIRNLFLIVILFFLGCYLVDGKETLRNINEKMKGGYEKFVSSAVYEKARDEIFAEK